MKSLIFIGFFAAGKSTIGREVSKAIKMPFLDSDREIERHYFHASKQELSVYEIHQKLGENQFRNLEAQVILELPKENHIIATGGGSILLEENRLVLKEKGFIIYLQAELSTLISHMQKSRFPSYLNPLDPINHLKEIASYRFPLYKELADIIIETDQLSFNDIIERCLSHAQQ